MNLYLHNLRILGRYASGIFRFFSAPTKKIGHAHGKAQQVETGGKKAHDNCCICGYICSSIIWNNLGGKLIFIPWRSELNRAGSKQLYFFGCITAYK